MLVSRTQSARWAVWMEQFGKIVRCKVNQAEFYKLSSVQLAASVTFEVVVMNERIWIHLKQCEQLYSEFSEASVMMIVKYHTEGNYSNQA